MSTLPWRFHNRLVRPPVKPEGGGWARRRVQFPYPEAQGNLTFWAPFDDPSTPLRVLTGGPLTFVRATTATYLHPTTGLVTSAGSGVLRIEANGALIEGARTNLVLQSQTLGTTWTPSNITVSDNDGVSPDGATNAELLTATAGNGTLIQDLGVVASAAKTYSIYLKRKTGTGNIDLTLDNGGTWTTKTITTSWVRYEITATVADPDVGIRIVTSGDAVWAWGGQLEDSASFASSYIPTVAASVTRDKDELTFASSGTVIDAAGTFSFSINARVIGSNRRPLSFSGANGVFYTNTGQVRMFDGTAAVVSDSSISDLVTSKIGVRWSGSNLISSVDGVLDSSSGTYDGSWNAAINAQIGTATGGATDSAYIYGHIKNLRIYNKALSDARMIGLTS